MVSSEITNNQKYENMEESLCMMLSNAGVIPIINETDGWDVYINVLGNDGSGIIDADATTTFDDRTPESIAVFVGFKKKSSNQC